MSRKKTAYTTYLEPAQVERLQKLSEQTRVPASAYIRRAIERELERVEMNLKLDPAPPSPLADFVPKSAKAMNVVRGGDLSRIRRGLPPLAIGQGPGGDEE